MHEIKNAKVKETIKILIHPKKQRNEWFRNECKNGYRARRNNKGGDWKRKCYFKELQFQNNLKTGQGIKQNTVVNCLI